MKMPVTLDAMNQIKGGMPARMIEKQLARIAADIAQAPDQPDWREVTFKIRAKPRSTIVNQRVELVGVSIEFVAAHRTPNRVTSLDADLRQNINTGQMEFIFEQDAPDNVQQASLLDALEPSEQSHQGFDEDDDED